MKGLWIILSFLFVLSHFLQWTCITCVVKIKVIWEKKKSGLLEGQIQPYPQGSTSPTIGSPLAHDYLCAKSRHSVLTHLVPEAQGRHQAFTCLVLHSLQMKMHRSQRVRGSGEAPGSQAQASLLKRAQIKTGTEAALCHLPRQHLTGRNTHPADFGCCMASPLQAYF